MACDDGAVITRPILLRAVALALTTGLVASACSRSDDDLAEPAPSDASTSTSIAEQPSTSAMPSTSAPAPETTPTTPETTAAPTLPPPEPAVTVSELEETGTPGLDSDDAFCSSWSRFAGSFQVVAVTAAFGTGPPEQLAALEVAAAPTVTTAYDDLLANWPDELADEESLVADEFLGPFARRLTEARDALDSVGADDATVAAISEAWLAGLAQRDPSTPEFAIDLSDEEWATIDEAAIVFAAQRVPFGTDPSLVTNVVTPLTDEYLAVSCPDQGTLSGQEVDSP